MMVEAQIVLRAKYFQDFLNCAGNFTGKFLWDEPVYLKPTVYISFDLITYDKVRDFYQNYNFVNEFPF
jgi:hypothetical protein